MELLIPWIILSFVIAVLGEKRKIGAGPAFFVSLFLSPLIGFICVFASQRKPEEQKLPRKMNDLIIAGDRLMKKNMFEEALEKYQTSLAYSDKAPTSHIRLAWVYSMKKDASNAYNHLIRAINDGFTDFKQVSESKYLGYLREQPQFKALVTNGYKDTPPATRQPMSKVEDLERLAQLAEKGVLSKEEFEAEKKRVLEA
jgi:tetratricopeptide (TPR) repeat protein